MIIERTKLLLAGTVLIGVLGSGTLGYARTDSTVTAPAGDVDTLAAPLTTSTPFADPPPTGAVVATVFGIVATQIGCANSLMNFKNTGSFPQTVSGRLAGGSSPIGTVNCSWAASWLSVPIGEQEVCAKFVGGGSESCGTVEVKQGQTATITL